jgi:hypothetical protein
MNTNTTTPQIEFTCSYNNGYYLTTDLELKGRGIKKVGERNEHKRNKLTYQVTYVAMNKLEKIYSTQYYNN